VAFLHADADFGLEVGQPGRLLRRCQLLEVRRPVGIEAELGVSREPNIDLGRQRREDFMGVSRWNSVKRRLVKVS